MIDVYSKPQCPKCTSTYRAFESKGLREGVDWCKHDLSLPENDAALQWVMNDLGYSEAPIVYVDENNHWCGFRPDKIITLKPEG